MVRTGRPIAGNAKSQMLRVRIEPNLLKRLDETAKERKSNRSELIREAVERIVEEEDARMIEVIDKLEKAETLLHSWTEDYLFANRPNPKLIFGGADSIEKEQAVKWNREYDQITTLIQIVKDYVGDAKNVLLDKES